MLLKAPHSLARVLKEETFAAAGRDNDAEAGKSAALEYANSAGLRL